MAENRRELLSGIDLFVLDLDGTFYLGDEVLPGAMDFLAKCRACGKDYLFFTNNSSRSGQEYVERLTRMGVAVTRRDIVTSGDVMIAYLKRNHPGARVYLMGTPALEAEFSEQGICLVTDSPEIAVASFDKTLTYDKLELICRAIREGAVFLATHPDINCPTENGFIPDCGAFIAAISLSTGVSPKITGKPYGETVEAVCEARGVPRERIAFVGDRLYTDIAAGVNNGAKGLLVLTGESSVEDIANSAVRPDAVFASLGEIGEYIS